MAGFQVGRKSGSGERRGSSETVAIRIDSVHASGKTPNHAEDYALGTLIHNACGMEAKYDGETPVTQVKIRQRPPRGPVNPENPPYAIRDLREGAAKGNAKPNGKHPIAIFESAYFDSKAGELSVDWINIGALDSPEKLFVHDALSDKTAVSFVHSNVYTTVSEEFDGKDQDGNLKKKQNRNVYMPEYGEIIAGDPANNKSAKDVLIERAAPYLASELIYEDGADPVPVSSKGGARPAVILRISKLVLGQDEPEMVQSAWLSARTDGGELSAEEAVERFFEEQEKNDTEGNGNFKYFVENIDSDEGKDYVIEMIPVWTFGTGGKSTPTAKSQAAKKPVEGDERLFRVPNFNRETGAVAFPDESSKYAKKDKDGNILPYSSQLIAQGHVLIRRRWDIDENKHHPWSASRTFLAKPWETFYHHINDLPTAVTPDSVLNRFMQTAALRNERLIEYRKSKSAANIPAPAAEGVPDDSNGLDGSSFSPS